MNWKPVVNVGTTERALAGFLGGALLAGALKARKPLLLIGPALLFYRAFTGNCRGYQLLGVTTCRLTTQ